MAIFIVGGAKQHSGERMGEEDIRVVMCCFTYEPF